MPSHPTLFDEPGDPRRDADPAAADPGGRYPAVAGTGDGDGSGRGSPNYLARRAVVVGAVVVVIALAAIGIGRLIGGGDDGQGGSGADADWNRLVLFDARRGEFTLLGDDGTEKAVRASGIRNADAHAVADRTAVVTTEEATAIVDLADGSTDERDVGGATIVVPTGTTRTMAVPTTDGARALLVHGPSGDVIDTAEYAPVAGATYDFARAVSTPSGRSVLVTDTGNFQTVLFSFDGDEPAYFPGLALAIDDDVVVTAQNVGDQATVNAFDHDGTQTATGRTATVRAALLGDDAVVLVTVDGEVATMALDSGDTESGTPLAIGAVTSGTVTPTGDRLVIVGEGGTQIVDPEGEIVGVFAGLTPLADTGALRGSTCLLLSGQLDDTGARTDLMVADIQTGTAGERVEIATDNVARSADGCTIAVETADGTATLTVDGIAGELDGALVALAPDATRVVVDDAGTLLLVPVASADDSDADDDVIVELGRAGPPVTFVEV